MRRDRASGQGIIEYLLVLVLLAVVVIVFLSFSEEFFGKVREFFGGSPQSEPTPTSTLSPVIIPTPIVTHEPVQYGEVFYTGGTVTRVIDTQVIDIPNCNGSSEIERVRTFTKTISREVRILTGAEAELEISVLRVYINGQLGTDETETIGDSQQITLRAAPNSSISYTVKFVEESKVGMLEVIQGSRTQYIEFAIPSVINIQQEEPTRITCD